LEKKGGGISSALPKGKRARTGAYLRYLLGEEGENLHAQESIKGYHRRIGNVPFRKIRKGRPI